VPENVRHLSWAIVGAWQCYFYVTHGWSIYPGFIPEGDQIVRWKEFPPFDLATRLWATGIPIRQMQEFAQLFRERPEAIALSSRHFGSS
jgi:hypothetical protein